MEDFLVGGKREKTPKIARYTGENGQHWYRKQVGAKGAKQKKEPGGPFQKIGGREKRNAKAQNLSWKEEEEDPVPGHT